eukprot:scaffold103297_cov46-Prasinocladus_malaysianus.AAC.1
MCPMAVHDQFPIPGESLQSIDLSMLQVLVRLLSLRFGHWRRRSPGRWKPVAGPELCSSHHALAKTIAERCPNHLDIGNWIRQ